MSSISSIKGAGQWPSLFRGLQQPCLVGYQLVETATEPGRISFSLASVHKTEKSQNRLVYCWQRRWRNESANVRKQQKFGDCKSKKAIQEVRRSSRCVTEQSLESWQKSWLDFSNAVQSFAQKNTPGFQSVLSSSEVLTVVVAMQKNLQSFHVHNRKWSPHTKHGGVFWECNFWRDMFKIKPHF